jgi:transcriptional regulator with XRE-family HTH domain
MERKKPTFYTEIGQKIKSLRERRGLTQERLAELAELSPTYISHIERGKKHVSLTALISLAAALEVPAERLLCDVKSTDQNAFLPEVQALLADCSPHERCILLEIAEAAKQSLRRNRWVA